MTSPRMSDEYATAFRARLLTHVADTAPAGQATGRAVSAQDRASTSPPGSGVRPRTRTAPRGRVLIPALVAVVLVAGVVAGVVGSALQNRAGLPAGTPSTVAPTATPLSAPAPCVKWERSDMNSTPGGEAIAAAATTANLADTVVLSPGIQVLASTDKPGMFSATAFVCAESWNREELVLAATAIAQAIYADPAHQQLDVLEVAGWAPIDSDAIGEAPNLSRISTDYQLHQWDAPAQTLTAAWK